MVSLFSRIAVFVLAFLSLQTLATPIARPDSENTVSRRNVTPFSLNLWGGFQSLDKFDDFFGIDNFDGSRNAQILLAQQDLICRQQSISRVQQQLLVVQEFAKRILLEQVCEVELQAILVQQLLGGFSLFGNDLRRLNGRVPGFDANVAGLLLQLLDDQNQFKGLNFDFGFTGVNLGQHLLVPSGSNFDILKSPGSLSNLDDALKLVLASTKFGGF